MQLVYNSHTFSCQALTVVRIIFSDFQHFPAFFHIMTFCESNNSWQLVSPFGPWSVPAEKSPWILTLGNQTCYRSNENIIIWINSVVGVRLKSCLKSCFCTFFTLFFSSKRGDHENQRDADWEVYGWHGYFLTELLKMLKDIFSTIKSELSDVPKHMIYYIYFSSEKCPRLILIYEKGSNMRTLKIF